MKEASLEIEFKAGVDADTLTRIGQQVAEVEGEALEKRLRSVYFDTLDMRLEQAGISLRLRLADDRWTQTLKFNRTEGAGMRRATEIEAHLSGVDMGLESAPEPDLSLVADVGMRAHILDVIGDAPLAIMCETHVRRRSHVIATHRGRVELALDAGDILAGDARQPVSEVEAELVSGDAEAVFECADAILGDKVARLVLPNKAARGMALAKTGVSLPERAVRTTSTQEIDGALYDARSADEAFAVLIDAYAQAMSENLYVVLTSADPEGPHQLRVVLRRLRALHGAFRLHIRRKATRYISRLARHHGRIVSRLRDADVMVDEVLRPAVSDDEAGRRLLGALEVWREGVRSQVRAELLQARATGFAIELAALADTEDWRPRGVHRRRRLAGAISSVLFHELDELWDVARSHGKHVSTMHALDRHALRKDLKNLRYAAEIAVCNREGVAFEGFFKQLQALQSDLGYLNDIATLEAFAPNLGDVSAMHTLTGVRESLLADVEARRDKKLARLDKRWKAFRRETHFWM